MEGNINTIAEIPTTTEEGQLLVAAIATITMLPGFTNKTPDEALQHVKHTAWEIFAPENQSFVIEPAFGYCVNCKSNVALTKIEDVYRCNLCATEADPSEDAHEGNSI